eukprot:TRINITY_DN23108_c0_g1_i2.p1 TRINITY_DN23108_c0_g1~~TRINITY_DN23108_c0_g1_i2.p1  ORF type:complete len:649 (+),score=148.88 TRINITY_DN23108_c0_g1_i2:196-2142(+)
MQRQGGSPDAQAAASAPSQVTESIIDDAFYSAFAEFAYQGSQATGSAEAQEALQTARASGVYDRSGSVCTESWRASLFGEGHLSKVDVAKLSGFKSLAAGWATEFLNNNQSDQQASGEEISIEGAAAKLAGRISLTNLSGALSRSTGFALFGDLLKRREKALKAARLVCRHTYTVLSAKPWKHCSVEERRSSLSQSEVEEANVTSNLALRPQAKTHLQRQPWMEEQQEGARSQRERRRDTDDGAGSEASSQGGAEDSEAGSLHTLAYGALGANRGLPGNFKRLAALYGPEADAALAQAARRRPPWPPGSSGEFSSGSGARPSPPQRTPLSSRGKSAGMAHGNTTPARQANLSARSSNGPWSSRHSSSATPTSSRTSGRRTAGHSDPSQSDQDRLRKRFKQNMQETRKRATLVKMKDQVLQEYHWLKRDMQVESESREQEQAWQLREAERAEKLRQQRLAFLSQGEASMNIRYGKMMTLEEPSEPEHHLDEEDAFEVAPQLQEQAAEVSAEDSGTAVDKDGGMDKARLEAWMNMYRASVGRHVDIEKALHCDPKPARPPPTPGNPAEALLAPGRVAFMNHPESWAKWPHRGGKLPSVQGALSEKAGRSIRHSQAEVKIFVPPPVAPLPLLARFNTSAQPVLPPRAWQTD